MSLLTAEVKTEEDNSFCLSRRAWGAWNEIYNVHRAVVLVPWHSSPPETPPDIFLFCFSFKDLGLYDV